MFLSTGDLAKKKTGKNQSIPLAAWHRMFNLRADWQRRSPLQDWADAEASLKPRVSGISSDDIPFENRGTLGRQ